MITTHLPVRATLHIGRKEACVFWSHRTESGVLVFALEASNLAPQIVWGAAQSALREEMQRRSVPISNRCLWRLVLPGGFYAMAQRPQGRWSTTLATAAANELEGVCPVALDDLHTAAFPLNATSAWVCGFSHTTLRQWQQAAQEANVTLVGVWTQASALVEWASEAGTSDKSARWQDGFVRVELEGMSTTSPSPEGTIDHVRVYACRDAPKIVGFGIAEGEAVAHIPGWAAHRLLEIDPSESLNLLRGPYRSFVQRQQIQWPLAQAAALWAMVMIILAVANLANAHAFQKQSLAAQQKIASVWHQTQGTAPLPALAVTTLEQQAASWRAARNTLPVLGPTRPSMVAVWAALVEKLPSDLTVNVSSLRTRSREVWIDGQTKSQADARRLEAVWDSVPSLKADPMRLSAGGGEGGGVSFSIRMVMR